MPSAEFPGSLAGLNPKSYGLGRPYGALIWVVIHCTDGSEDPQAAENGNAYDARRTDEVSTHVFVDANSVVTEVQSVNRAWAARTVANNRGYQVEFCGTAAQSVAQWKDQNSLPELELGAKHVAYVSRKYGIPPRWCTQADVDARRPGFLTHAMVSAWLEGTHTDPGVNFPFAWFLGRVAYYLSLLDPPPVIPTPAPTVKDNDMAVIKLANSAAYYATVPGVGYYHVTDMDEASDLMAAYGPVTVVKALGSFGQEIASPRVATKAFAYVDDTQTDDPAGNNEHDPAAGPQ